MKEFAPSFSRDKLGRVLFPRSDADLRNELFTFTDSTMHVAKCNMYMVREVVRFVSEPGETICDPFSGTGTVLVAVTLARKVICIEIESVFQDMILRNIEAMRVSYPDIEDLTNLIPGDCNKVLPVPGFCNHMIFSPPWANVLRKKSVDQFAIDAGYGSATLYTQSQDNIGNLSDFLYHQKMERVYKKFFDSITPGGTMTIIIKDRMEAGVRVEQGKRAQRDCLRIGFKELAWNKWQALGGGFAAYNRSIGQETVDEEDLITLRRP